MSCGSTKLVVRIDGNQVSITDLIGNGMPRSKPGTSQLSHNSYGTPQTDGLSFEPRFLFEVEALVSSDDADMLDLIFSISQSTKQPVRVYDYTRRIVEPTPRSRAIAPDSTEETPTTGYVSYHPRFDAWFQGEPIRRPDGGFERVSFTLLETEAVPA